MWGRVGRGHRRFATEDHDTAACGAVAVMPSHLTVRCQRQRLNFIRRGPEGSQIPLKELSFNSLSSNHGLPNGRSDWRSSPPAAKSAVFYRRSGTKSRHRTPRKAKLACSDFAVEAGSVNGDH